MPNQQCPKSPRRAHSDELDTILVLANDVMRIKQGRKPTIATDYPFVYNHGNAGDVTVIMNGNLAVSMVGTWMNTVEVGSARLRVGGRRKQLPPGSQDQVANSPELTLVTPVRGHPFIDLLRPLRVPCEEDYWGMLYIIDPGSILEAFGLTDIAVTEKNGQFTLTRDDESVSVSRQELAKFLFGSERISDFAEDILPLLFWEWPMEHV